MTFDARKVELIPKSILDLPLHGGLSRKQGYYNTEEFLNYKDRIFVSNDNIPR